MSNAGHYTESDQIVRPAAIAGWDWGYDEFDATWSIFHTGHPDTVVTWRRRRKDDGPMALHIVIDGDAPEAIVLAVYAANRRSL